MSTTVNYKGSTIATVENQTKVLSTAGKWLEGDIQLVDVSSSPPSLQSKSVSYTPTESAQTATVTADTGYDGLGSVAVSVGAISGTYVGSQVPTQAAQTIHPSTSAQTIASGKYLTGNQTIEAVTTANLTAANIVSGVTVKVGSATDDDCIVSVTGTAIEGVDIPVFTVVWDSNWEDVVSVTCNKTWGECYYGLIEDNIATATTNETNQTDSYDGYYTFLGNSSSSSLTYIVMMGPIPTYDIIYNSDGTLSITQPSSRNEILNATTNGTYYPQIGMIGQVNVNVQPTLQSKSATPSETAQTISADSGYDGLSQVSVGAISSTYVGSGIDRNDSTDLTTSGATVTAPAGYYAQAASKSVASGSATTPTTTISVTPSISVNASGLITASASGSQSVTPTVSAGYVSSGTAGTVSVSGSNTQQLTTQGAQTIHPSSTAQTIASGRYLTGAQTIEAVTTNLTADKIASGFTAKIGSATDDDCVVSIVGTASGGTYRRTLILPQQTITPNSSRTAVLSNMSMLEDGAAYIVTFDGVEWTWTCETMWTSAYTLGDVNLYFGNSGDFVAPFGLGMDFQGNADIAVKDTNQHTVKIEKLELVDDGEILTTKTITQNGTYNAADDDADGYSSVTVNIPSGSPTLQAKTNISPTTSSQTIRPDSGYDGLSSVQINAMPTGTAGTPTATKGTVSNHSVSVTPSVTNTTGYITGGTKTGTAVSVSASELVSGNLAISQNGNNIDVTNYETVSVSVSGGGSTKNVQYYMGVDSVNAGSYTATDVALTVSKTGTYKVSWIGWRSTSSGTSGSQLYINGTAYGSANTTFTGTYGQAITLSGVSLTQGDALVVRARSRNTSNYMYVGNLIIEEQ